MSIEYKMQTIPETQKRTRAKKGGSVSDVAQHTSGLIVPWAILLAKQALQGVLDKPEEKKVGIASSSKKTPAKKTPAKKTPAKKQSGGNCSSCAAASSSTKKTVKGGSKEKAQNKNQYNELANKIQDFLSRY